MFWHFLCKLVNKLKGGGWWGEAFNEEEDGGLLLFCLVFESFFKQATSTSSSSNPSLSSILLYFVLFGFHDLVGKTGIFYLNINYHPCCIVSMMLFFHFRSRGREIPGGRSME